MKHKLYQLLVALGLMITISLQSYAQNLFKIAESSILLQTTEGERLFNRGTIHVNLYLDQGTIVLRGKTGTFLKGLAKQDSADLSIILNSHQKGEFEFMGKLPEGYRLPTDGKYHEVTVKGFIRVAGIRREVSQPIKLSSDGAVASIQFDQFIDLRAWGAQFPKKSPINYTGLARFIIKA